MAKINHTLNTFLPLYLEYARGKLKHKTVNEYERLIKTNLQPEFGVEKLTSFSTKKVEQWHIRIKAKTPHLANRALAVLSGVLKLAARWGYIQSNPVNGIEYAKEKKREVYLDPDARSRLLGVTYSQDPIDCAFLLTAYYTGARPGELQKAKKAWIQGNVIRCLDAKTGDRNIYLPPEAQKAILSVPAHDSELIFPGVNTSVLWRRVRKEAKLEGYRLYDLRHTFASAALEGGASLEAISQLLGHNDPKTTRRYTHLTNKAGNETAARTAAVLSELD